ncbi:hypothetical protein LIER_25209 [Lithospermum erythrorhizon]|uniref:Uncharacterized protein n=1 Tax=Lithospermum erythrorhizon TaxID=34254 RepID=A0AAV3R3Y1_LITER
MSSFMRTFSLTNFLNSSFLQQILMCYFVVPIDHILPNTVSTSRPICSNHNSGSTQVDVLVNNNSPAVVTDLSDNVHDTSSNNDIDHNTSTNILPSRFSARDKKPPM